MVSCKLVFTFIFAITLAINVVPSSAAGSRKTSPQSTAPPSPHSTAPSTPHGSAPPSPRGSITPSLRGSVTPSPRGSVTPSPRGSVPPSPRSSITPSLSGSVTPSPRDSVPTSPRGSVTPSPRGSVPTSPRSSVTLSPHGTASSSPFGTAPSSPFGSPPLSPTRIELSVPERVPNKNRGEHNFGEFVPGERLLGLETHIHKTQPDPSVALYGGVHTCNVTIKSPNGQRITRFEVDSCLGFQSEGEHVNFEGYSPNHDAVHLRIWSRRFTNIDYKIRLYGL